MRKAFGKDGPLYRADEHPAEEGALAHLFAGAIGYCRNPTSHRNIDLVASEAVEMIMLACLLLRVVDERSLASSS